MSEIIKVRAFPFFERGRTFSSDMITSIRDYTFDYSNLFLANCSDGIVSGCKVEASDKYLSLTKGVIKFKEMVYILNQPLFEAYEATENEQVLRLDFSEELKTEKSSHREVQLNLGQLEDLSENSMEICRFKLKKGSVLRTTYLNFEDQNTGYDTVNQLYAAYAGREKATLSLDVLTSFAREAMAYELSTLDTQFVLSILSANFFFNRQAIESYIALRKQAPFKDLSTIELYEGLLEILNDIKGSSSRKTKNRGHKKRQIIVD
jgi:hypothetical protein